MSEVASFIVATSYSPVTGLGSCVIITKIRTCVRDFRFGKMVQGMQNGSRSARTEASREVHVSVDPIRPKTKQNKKTKQNSAKFFECSTLT